MLNADEFENAARSVEANPLGRIMYGQRELFHSNFISWYFDFLPDAADATFLPLTRPGTGSNARRVDRERNHMDLVFHWTDHTPLIVENKVFAIPTRSQLDSYEEAARTWKIGATFLLLAPSVPQFEHGSWRHLSYDELADRIDATLPPTTEYNVETVRHYASLLRSLQRLVSTVDVHDGNEPVWIPPETLDAVRSSQMRAALKKARAQRVADQLNQQMTEIDVGSGMSNSTPIVQSFQNISIPGARVALGWQLQGNQFRRIAIYPSLEGRSDRMRDRRERFSREHPEFFRFPDSMPQEHAGRKEFNHYAPDFVYNYVNVPSLTVAELKSAASAVQAEIREMAAPGNSMN